MLPKNLPYFRFPNLLLALLCLLGNACTSTYPLLEREWMEVRNAAPSGESVSVPDSYFHFKKRGKFIADFYYESGYRTEGTFVVKDSVLSIQSEEGKRLWYIASIKDFIIQQLDEDQLVLLAHQKNKEGIRPHKVRTFIPLEKYKRYTPQEIKEKYSFTTQDSLNDLANIKRANEYLALRANDRYSAIYPGGESAIRDFVRTHLEYPPDHTERKMVVVEFVVNKDGSLSDLKTRAREVPEPYLTEAKKVVRLMTDWESAIIKGQPEPANKKILIIFEKKETQK